ncbi:MAG: hypothetical protein WAL98_09040 [Desulfatiglandaceae bacterium]|jgi:hypothetical protein
MKKAFMSPLCSGLVIPGLGQILNQQLKKGSCILLLILILFVWGTIALFNLFKSVFSIAQITGNGGESIIDRLRQQDLSTLLIILGTFVAVWLYSVLDAFFTGRKIDRDSDLERP